MQYLSDESITRANDALAAKWTGRTVEGDSTCVVVYEVSGGPTGKLRYHLFFGPDGAGVSQGDPEAAHAEMTLDWATATEIAQGQLSAQVAFMQGRLKLGGDVMVLIRHADVLSDVSDALVGLQPDTTY